MSNPKQYGSIKKLSFLVAGVEKAGTSALDLYLRQHPYLLLPESKESRFFDSDTIDWTRPNFTAYEYRGNLGNEATIAGENTPNYIYWPNTLERVKCYNPDMKLIFLFRQPVERAWSHWKMSYREHLETKPFSWAIREGRARLANITIYPGYHWVFSYVERGFYGQQLTKVLQLFPRKQLLLLLHEDLKANPTEVLRKISRFLGVPELKEEIKQLSTNVAPEANNSSSVNEADVTYLQSLYNDDLRLFARLSGLDITSWFH